MRLFSFRKLSCDLSMFRAENTTQSFLRDISQSVSKRSAIALWMLECAGCGNKAGIFVENRLLQVV